MPSDYERVERAIRFIDAHYHEQPSLQDVAEHVGLSPSHFQRLFQRWAGVSPKRFLQLVTAEHARRLLRASGSTLDVAWTLGLSSPSRLHDLLVSLDAVTPGEFGAGGEGLEIRYGVHDSPFGLCFIAVTERGVCALHFLGDAPAEPLSALRKDWPEAALREDPAGAGEVLQGVFPREPGTGQPLPVLVRGTNFQVQVWDALLRVPPGAATTYGHLARSLGMPRAARAVGTAVGRNPIAYLIPCHRVLRASGAFGEYRWGAERKRAMLAWEATRHAAPA
jgi:AraC family transcriptional regulator, regulatory protein of adaptative response / methylated-DNA-[protein]-cysteine methyltransferase